MKGRRAGIRTAAVALGLTILGLLVLDFGVRSAIFAVTKRRLRDRNVLYINQAGLFARGLVTLRLQVREYRAAGGALNIGPLHVVVNGRGRAPLSVGESATWGQGLSAFFLSYRNLDRVLNPQVGVPWADEPDVPVVWVDVGTSRSHPRFPQIQARDIRTRESVDVPPVAESSPGAYAATDVPLPRDPGVQAPGFLAAGPRLFVCYWGTPRRYSLILLPVQYVPAGRRIVVAERMDILAQLEPAGSRRVPWQEEGLELGSQMGYNY